MTRARTCAQLDVKCDETQLWNLSVADLPWSSCNRELVKVQKLDPSLKDLLDMVCDTEVISNLCHCYFLQKRGVIEEMGDPRRTLYR